MSDEKPPWLPDGFLPVTPLLTVHDAERAIDYYVHAFEAEEVGRLTGRDGSVVHAEMRINGGMIMLAEENPEVNTSPRTLGGSPVMIHLYVEDVDAVMRRAAVGGGDVLIPAGDQFYGDRSGRIRDPFGHIWIISTHQEDVSTSEAQRRLTELMRR